jgi:biuret amidohydrolase
LESANIPVISIGNGRIIIRQATQFPGIIKAAPLASFLQHFRVELETGMPRVMFDAEPSPLAVELGVSALIIIDMQRDFLEAGGFGAALGNDVSRLQAAVTPCRAVLVAARRIGMLIIHTREGHRPDLSDAPPLKVARGDPSNRIGARGPMGRILVRGEPGHDIIPELYPLKTEPVIDKPGKGAFYQTDLELMLRNQGIDTLFVCGVTTEVCVNTTVREANDRGFRCIVLADCCASYFPEFHEAGLAMIKAQGGIFGWVARSKALLDAITAVPDQTTYRSMPDAR